MNLKQEYQEIVDLFNTLLAEPSPSGREHQLAAKIKTLLASWGYRPEIDNAGNLLVEVNGTATDNRVICYASHMDEIGFTISDILPDGRLKAFRRGGLFPWKMGEAPVEILTESDKTITGIISMGAGHKLPSNHGVTWENVTIFTGLTAKTLKEKGISKGAAGVLARSACGPTLFGPEDDPFISAWTFDDKMGCVVLLRLLKALSETGATPIHNTLFAFTTREEVGGLGARHLAQTRQPDLFIAVDGAPMPPSAGLNLDQPVLWMSDRLGPYDIELARDISQVGQSVGVEIQRAAYDVSASDASLITQAGGTGRIACFGHPRENSHGYEIARLSVFEAVFQVVREFALTRQLAE